MRNLKKCFMGIMVVVIVMSTVGCNSSPIDTVKEGYLDFDQSITVGNVLENNQYLKNQEWTSFESEMGRTMVEFTADMDLADCNPPEYRDMFNKYDARIKLTIQFNIMDSVFEVRYIGTRVECSEKLIPYFNKLDKSLCIDENPLPDTVINKAFTNLWNNKPMLSFGGSSLTIRDAARAYERERARLEKKHTVAMKAKPHILRIFDIYGEILNEYATKTKATKVEILQRDDNTHLVIIYPNSGWLGGYIHIISADEHSVCELESALIEEQNGIIVENCPDMILSGSLTKGYELQYQNCDLCGMNGTLEGIYDFVVKIKFINDSDGYIYPQDIQFPDITSKYFEKSLGKSWWVE